MRRIKKLIVMLATVTGIMLITPILPAMAEEEAAGSTIFFPYGNGATYSCTGGPPFVFDSAGSGNCSVEQLGRGLTSPLCDIPTTIIFVHQGHRWAADARLCQ
jgi:hypothetical protein